MKRFALSCVVLIICLAAMPCLAQEPPSGSGSSLFPPPRNRSLLNDPYNFHGGDTKPELPRSGSRAFDLINGKSPSLDSSSLSETLRRMRESNKRIDELIRPHVTLQPPSQPWWMTLKDKAISLVKSLLGLAGLLIMGFIGLVALFWIGYSGWSLKRSVDVRGGVKRNPQFQSDDKTSSQ